MKMSIRIIKMVSGELIIGRLETNTSKISLGAEEATDDSTTPVRTLGKFTLVNPMLLHFTPQGMGLAPIMPWTQPDAGAGAEFYSDMVMGEVMNTETSIHAPIVKEYQQITSRIMMASAGNVSPLRP